MNTLGKYYHDFPRLAKESGYNFQLFRGKINWIDLDKVDTQEIIDNRNFQLLEDNLIQIINCNLEKEFDVSGLDGNFVKLFKLAQLGVDYLSYCELYLDRCVILLQEQLSALQEQFLLLKEENEKKDEELKRHKQKIKLQSQNYKCNKCEKIFLNETYLKSHEKRRHQDSTDLNGGKTFHNQSQQTEEEIKSVSVLTQTVHDEMPLSNCESDDKDFVKINEQELKIDNLKRDLEELKARLSLAEKTMEEKKNDEKNFQNSFPNPVIPVIHSYISPNKNGFFQMSGAAAVIQSFPGQFVLQEDADESHDALKKVNKIRTKEELNKSSDQYLLKEVLFDHQPTVDSAPAPEVTLEEREKNEGPSKNEYVNLENNPSHSPPQRFDESASKPESDVLVQEIHPKTNIIRKTKKNQVNLEVEEIVDDSESSIWGPSVIVSNSDSRLESESTNDNIQMRTSTPSKILVSPKTKMRETSFKSKWSNAFSPATGEAMKRKSKSEETLIQDTDTTDNQEKSKSILRKIVTKKSPKIQGLKTNLKHSFSQLYESVSSAAKKNSDVEQGKSKTDIVEGLHNRLKDLGIDPEWSGIPKATMKQKLKILEHHRNLLAKENRLYPFLRRKLEKHVLKRIQGNSLLSKKQATETSDGSVTQENNENCVNINISPSEITVYDSDGDSESDVVESSKDKKTNSPGPSETGNKNTEAGPSKVSYERKDEERETTDFSIFQAGKFKEGKAKVIELEVPDEILERQKYPSAQDELQTDSDFDDELFKRFEEQSIQNIAKHLSGKAESSNKDIIGSFPEKVEDNNEFLSSYNVKSENQSILKSETETSKLTAKKKVLFAEVPEIFEAAAKPVTKTLVEKQKITNSVLDDDDDDDWSIESEWTINNEL